MSDAHEAVGARAVPRRWPNSTVVCLASGPSLTPEDVAFCRGKAPVIAVNNTAYLAPWADAMVGSDYSWWLHHEGMPAFRGEKWGLIHQTWKQPERWPDIGRLRITGDHGIETNPSATRTGFNSGYLAVNIAIHYGATRVVLLGYDMGYKPNGPKHYFGDHSWAPGQVSPYQRFIDAFQTMGPDLARLGVEVVNASRRTALTCFPQMALADALACEVAA